MNWTPETTFCFTYIVSALTALGGICLSNKTITMRVVIGTLLVYGGIGSSAGMFVYYKWFAGKDVWTALATGILVGGGAIKKKDVTDILRRLLGVKTNGNGSNDV